MTDVNIEDLLGEVQLPRKTAAICTRGDLVARWEEIHAQYRIAPDVGGSLADPSPRTKLARQLRELDDEMAGYHRTFVFQALPAPDWSKLLGEHPPVGKDIGVLRFNPESFQPALLARCCQSPAMSEEQAGRLLAKLSHGQSDALFEAAWKLNQGTVDIPFDGSVYAETPADDAS